MRKMLLFGLVAAGLLLAVWFTQMPACASASAGVFVGLEKTWGGANYEDARGVAVDQVGNIYVVGHTSSFGVDREAFILKYNSVGSLVWQKTWGGALEDYAFGVAVDQVGNIYVVGRTNSFGPSFDAFILKYNSVGSLVWQKTWGGADLDHARGVAVDQVGNIYVVGDTSSFGVNSDTFILKYNSVGSLVWQKAWGGNDWDAAFGVAVDQVGNIYVVGRTNSFGPGNNAFIQKYNAVGSLVWQKTWGGASFDIDYASGVAVDGANIYVVGTTDSFGTFSDAFILKYNSVGSLVWQKTWGGAEPDYAQGVAVDQVGNIYVVGDTNSFDAMTEAFILKYNAVGSLMWQKTWGGNMNEFGYGVVSGSVYVIGHTGSSPPRTLNDVSGTETTPSGTETTPGGTMITPSGTETTPNGTETTPNGEPSQGNDAFLISLLVHDVAVVDVTPSKTVVGQGYCMSINVTVENQGDYTETFNVTAYYGKAAITPEQWETFWSMGDANRDGYIDMTDFNIISSAFCTTPGDPGWCPWADLDQSNHVDTSDMMTCSVNIGLEIWTYFISGGVIGTQTVYDLSSGASTTITFTWDTTGVPHGSYTISAYAVPIFCVEEDRADNNWNDGIVLVTIPGDIDGDVDGNDFWMFAGVYPSDPALDPVCDIDGDGDVDGNDFWIFAGHYPTT